MTASIAATRNAAEQPRHTPRRDPRGESRRITRVVTDPKGGPTLIEYSCGHIGQHNQIFSYKVNEDTRCLQCGLALEFSTLAAEVADLRKALGIVSRESVAASEQVAELREALEQYREALRKTRGCIGYKEAEADLWFEWLESADRNAAKVQS